ncbi:SnoaL-like protein [Frondihabitans sp. PhB188]|uniref:nuclear transport factor 2 family protein n=1 Tax=Frondihabitans sp. PhB188 TaxID=2485200 RepID=UPI000F48CEF7|nr:nuclear transport factor 2 family protein [Frondihabitans sp. PhB188]ROQ38206.1 SnoaL-like protein [Frondihabitans sp. PhB188]
MTVATPSAIHSFIDTTNREDDTGFLACFADDATLDDWGRVFHGRDGVARWNESDNIGKHSRFDVVEVAAGSSADEFVVTVDVSGDGYNGVGTMTFVLAGERVKSLTIT